MGKEWCPIRIISIMLILTIPVSLTLKAHMTTILNGLRQFRQRPIVPPPIKRTGIQIGVSLMPKLKVLDQKRKISNNKKANVKIN